MCFGGGGGQQQSAANPNINITPMAPIVRTPEPPKQLTEQYKPLQSQSYQPGIQQAGATRRRRELESGLRSKARRRGLSIGLSASQAVPPSGGINL